MTLKVIYVLQSKLLKGDCIGDYIGTIIVVIRGDTRSLDYGSYRCAKPRTSALIVTSAPPKKLSVVGRS